MSITAQLETKNSINYIRSDRDGLADNENEFLAEHAEEIEKVRQYTITEFEKTKRYWILWKKTTAENHWQNMQKKLKKWDNILLLNLKRQKDIEFYERKPLQKITNNKQNKLQTQTNNMAARQIAAVQKLILSEFN